MNISKTDVILTMAMTCAVIFMSFTFPALGLTGEAQQENDIPEFNITKNAADFARESPEYPARPSQGTFRYENGTAEWEDERQVELQDGDPRYVASFFDRSSNGEPTQYEVNLIKFNGTGSYTTDTDINESESKTLESVDGAYELGLNNLDIKNDSTGNETATLDWEVLTQPSDNTWLGRIPVVGDIISGANQLAAVVGWIASIIWYQVTKVLVIIGNTLLMFFNIFAYFVEFMHWLIITYGNVVTGAPTAWASTIVAIPGILLGLQFAKFTAVGIKLLPFT